MLPNFKALGIEKDMAQAFEDIDKSDFQRLMDSCYFEGPYITKKQQNGHYCIIEITGCQHEAWWYRNLIGIQLFCMISFKDFKTKNIIKEFTGVRLSGNKQIIFRSISPKDAIII